MRLFLASESPRRRELLQKLVGNFTVKAAKVEEAAAISGVEPAAVALHNAQLKAAAVAEEFPADWVLGAFPKEDAEALAAALDRVQGGVELILKGDVPAAMQLCNGK